MERQNHKKHKGIEVEGSRRIDKAFQNKIMPNSAALAGDRQNHGKTKSWEARKQARHGRQTHEDPETTSVH
jgi:hypothetical protein